MIGALWITGILYIGMNIIEFKERRGKGVES